MLQFTHLAIGICGLLMVVGCAEKLGMNLSCLLPLLEATTSCKQLVDRLLMPRGEHKVIIIESAKPYSIAALHDYLKLHLVVRTAQPEKARLLHEHLQVWCSPSTGLYHFPELDFLPYEYLSSYSASAMWQRLQVKLVGPLVYLW